MARSSPALARISEAEQTAATIGEEVSTTVAALNRLIHEPARLAILTVLAACECADFVFLRTATGLTAGNLSIQLSRLEEGCLIEITKSIERRRTLTMVRLTFLGREQLQRYWRDMERLRMQVRDGAAPQGERVASATGKPVPAA